jgi:hypothetical protein
LRLATERPAPTAREEVIAGCWRPLTQPVAQRTEGAGQWGAPFLAALPDAADVRAGCEDDIGCVQADEFGHTQARVQRHDEERRVAPSDPGCAIGDRQQRFNFRAGEKSDQPAVGLLLRNREDTLDLLQVVWQVQRGESKEGPKGREASVARAQGIVPTGFEVMQEIDDERGVEIGDTEVGG